MSSYGFRTQLAIGQANETKLDAFFERWYVITPATMEQQRQGVDRIFTRRDTGEVFKIEYKTDYTAAGTGNAFVETISVDVDRKPGWAITSQARILLYYVPGPEVVYVIQFAQLRRQLARWEEIYPVRSIPNRGYHTHGLLVPLLEFERIAKQVISL